MADQARARVLAGVLLGLGVALAVVGVLMFELVRTWTSVGWGVGDYRVPLAFLALAILFVAVGVSMLTRRRAD